METNNYEERIKTCELKIAELEENVDGLTRCIGTLVSTVSGLQKQIMNLNDMVAKIMAHEASNMSAIMNAMKNSNN